LPQKGAPYNGKRKTGSGHAKELSDYPRGPGKNQELEKKGPAGEDGAKTTTGGGEEKLVPCKKTTAGEVLGKGGVT